MKLPYAVVEFAKDGEVADPGQVDAALAMLDREKPTDVLLVSHGWNNDRAAAERLFTRLTDNVADLIPAGSAAKLAVIGIVWPSLRWADEAEATGGGASVGDELGDLSAAIAQSVDDPELADRLTALAGRLDSAEGRAKFLSATRDLLPEPAGPGKADEEPAPAALRSGEAESVFDAVRVVLADSDDDLGEGTAASGGAPGVAPDLLDEGTSGAGLFGMSWPELGRQVLNTMTFYTMKARAGDVGARGVAPLVDRINAAAPGLRVHLAGHSFGGRVMAAAASNIKTPVESLTLLQGAFSHYGFTADYAGSGRDGAFRGALANGLIHGPVVISHTHNDKSIRLAYATAARLAGQAGAALGDRGDLYGGLGANGSQGTDAVEGVLGDATARYRFEAGRVYNLNADRTIASHGDVSNPAAANALAQAMGLR